MTKTDENSARTGATAAALLALTLSLAGCGDGGSGGVASTPNPTSTPTPTPTPISTPTPTPTPTPTAGANSSLVAPLATESFQNTAAYGSINVPTSGTLTTSSGAPSLSVVFDATTNRYTLSEGTRTVSFGSADRSAAQSNADLTTYVVTTGNITDSISLTTTGTGSGQTRYVGGGFWQRQVNGSSSVDGRFTAFTYGAQTAAASLPRSGAASFDVKLLGAHTISSSVWSMSGTGTLYADFASGGIAASGFYDDTEVASRSTVKGLSWQAYGLVSSNANNFAGYASFNISVNGALAGSFYGPNAQEIGAVWSGSSDNVTTAGAIFGARGTAPVNQATNFTNPPLPQFFSPVSSSLTASAAPGSGNLSAIAAGQGIQSVLFKDTNVQQKVYARDGRIMILSTGGPTLGIDQFGTLNRYSLASLVLDRRTATTLLDAYAFGFDTPAGGVPRTGSSSFDLTLRGGVAAAGNPLRLVSGKGLLAANFATGTLSTQGTYSIDTTLPGGGSCCGTAVDSGSWSGAGTLSTSANALSGNITFDGATDYAGTFAGRFFGPAAEEVGGSLSATAASGDRLVAAFTGPNGGFSGPAPTGLALLTGTASFPGVAAFYSQSPALAAGAATNIDSSIVTYDAATKAYTFASNASATSLGVDPLNKAFAGTDRNAAQSNATYSVYHGPAGDMRALNFGSGNPLIALTYSSFSEVSAPSTLSSGASATTTWYVNFGVSPGINVPRTGSATYTGIAVGRGLDGISGHEADLSGTSQLAVNFAAGTTTANMSLTSTDRTTNSARALGSFAYAGSIAGCPSLCLPVFSGTLNTVTARGDLKGAFYGDTFQEFGAGFNLTIDGATPAQASGFAGVAVGRKDP